jgi:PAS domain S-box-containing protein
MESVKTPRSPLVVPVSLFLALTILLTAAGWIYFVQTNRQIKSTAAAKLNAVADLKVTLLSGWRRERLQDATIFATAPINLPRIVPFLEKEPEIAGSDPEIKAWLDSIVTAKKYMDAVLIDAAGRVRLAAGLSAPRLGAYGRETIARVLASGEPFLSDFHRAAEIGPKIHLDLYAPILHRDPAGKAVCTGVFLFRIDPADFLYPILRNWPEPTQSAESFLIRRDGDDVLFLSDLRFRPNTALEFRVPAAAWDTAAAKAAQGARDMFEGKDYRGVRALSVIRPIPGTPWHLIVKEDLSEILEPLLARMSSFASMIIILCFGIGTLLLFWIKRREAGYFKKQYEIEHDRLALIQHFEYLHKYANDIVFLTDRNHRVIEANDRALAVYGFSREEITGLRIPDLRPPETKADFDGQLREAEKTGSLMYETLHRRKNGEVFPVEISLRLLNIGGERYHQAIIRDISERKKTEKRVMEALREKEVLLREIHHRVKNNMQVISSLLRLQSAKFAEAEVREAFRESQGRIKSMALVHEKLYGTQDLSRIDFADYVKSLTSSVFGSHQLSGRIALQLDLEKTFLDINAAVPCGLILNELILNALKHAFPNNREGKILVELRENENGSIRLTVRDNGIGLPEGCEPGKVESLGFQIISLLADQLEGRIDVRRENGTAITLRFKSLPCADPA